MTESPYKNELQKIANPQKPATLCRKSLNSKFGDAQRAKKAKYSDKTIKIQMTVGAFIAKKSIVRLKEMMIGFNA